MAHCLEFLNLKKMFTLTDFNKLQLQLSIYICCANTNCLVQIKSFIDYALFIDFLKNYFF